MRILSLFLFLFISFQAYADYTAYRVSNGSYQRTGATPELACQAFFADYAGRDYISASFPTCTGTHPFDGTWNVPMTSYTASGNCPLPLVDDGNGNCIIGSQCSAGETTQTYHTLTQLDNDPPPPTVNIDGCTYFSTAVTGCGVYDDGTRGCYYNWEATGDSSSEPEFQPPEQTAEKVNDFVRCQEGHYSGSLNGQNVCIAPTGDVSEPEPYVVNGQTRETVNSSSDNGDGTTTNTSTTTTVNNNGSTSTSTTTQIINNATGEVQSETTTSESEEKQTSFSGSGCDSAPSCSGDAIQCAIARQQHALNCQFDIDEAAITAEALGVDPEEDGVESLEGEDSIFDISELIDTTPFLAGSCPAPQTVNLGNFGTHDIQYTPLCSLAEILSFLVLASAGFLSIRIIGS